MSKDFSFSHFFLLLIRKKASSAARNEEKKCRVGLIVCFPCNLQANGYSSLNLLQYSIQATTLKNHPTEQTASDWKTKDALKNHLI